MKKMWHRTIDTKREAWQVEMAKIQGKKKREARWWKMRKVKKGWIKIYKEIRWIRMDGWNKRER